MSFLFWYYLVGVLYVFLYIDRHLLLLSGKFFFYHFAENISHVLDLCFSFSISIIHRFGIFIVSQIFWMLLPKFFFNFRLPFSLTVLSIPSALLSAT